VSSRMPVPLAGRRSRVDMTPQLEEGGLIHQRALRGSSLAIAPPVVL